MDEVFDLREKNQWLRRQIVAVLRQLIKAMFGKDIFSIYLDQCPIKISILRHNIIANDYKNDVYFR